MTARTNTSVVGLSGPANTREPGGGLRYWWSVIAASLVAAVLVEAIFAGAMLSGAGWARRAHAVTAMILLVSTVAASLCALVGLRRTAHGLRFGLTLLTLAAAILLQAAVGFQIAKGANLLWAHVPLGVALVAIATRVVSGARKLGEAS